METAQSTTGTVSCPRCQTANAPMARFCSLCGQTMQAGMGTVPPPQPPPPPPPVNRGMFLGGGGAGTPTPYEADVPTAFAAAMSAIQAGGGTVTWQAAPQSARFEIMKKDFLNTGGMKVRYDGELTVGAQSPRQSLVRLSLKANSSSLTPMILVSVVATLMLTVMSGPGGGMVLLLGIAAGAWQLYNVTSKLPGELTEKILRALPAPPMGMSAPASNGFPQQQQQQYAPVNPAANGGMGGSSPPPSGGGTLTVVEQLKQLAELRNVGAITPEEFEAKKAGLLARL